jgi:hypothetical protein
MNTHVAHEIPREGTASPIDKFLTPEAMLTPGAAGGVVMLIASVISHNFGLVPLYTSYLGLALSFVFGLLVLNSVRVWWIKFIYYMLNSLIIFCVAFGSVNLVATNGPAAGAIHPVSIILPKAEYAQLSAQFDDGFKTLSDLQQKGAPKADIDKQISILQDIHRLTANLNKQSAEVKDGSIFGDEISVINNPSQLFRRWPTPFGRF